MSSWIRQTVRAGFICAALCTPGWTDEQETEPPQLHRSLVVSHQGYFPVALRLQDGRIAIVLRGGDGHVGLKGRLDIVFSADEGQTWTTPTVVVDTPVDDRNPAFGQAADGTLVVAYWQYANFDEQGRPYRPMRTNLVSTWVTRSTDGGATWSQPVPIDVEEITWGSPFGRMLTLSDGAMLMAIYGGAVRTTADPSPITPQVGHIYKSTNHGQTWQRLSTLGPRCAEPALVRLASGKLLAAVRTSDSGGVALLQSADEGRSWSTPTRLTPDQVHPADLLLLPDGRVLMTVGYRVGPFGVRALIGDPEGGFDWQSRLLLENDLMSRDCGYPSTVVLNDGSLLTVYYGRNNVNRQWGVHCAAVTYRLPAGR